ncbi:MAG: hypothetical protein LBD04_08090 [Synergistaceae bacterium]|nr:hypothetical protein [Synergistaceae bacterium]
MECLLSMRLGYVLFLNLGAEVFSAVQRLFGRTLTLPPMDIRTFSEAVGTLYIENTLIEVFEVPSDLLRRAQDYGWRRWKDVLALSEAGLLTQGASYGALLRASDAYHLAKLALRIQEQEVLRPEICSLSETMFSLFAKNLSQRDLDVLIQRRGLDGGKPKTLEELGRAMNLTRERIRQIERKALRVLHGVKILDAFQFIAHLAEEKLKRTRGILSYDETVDWLQDVMGWPEVSELNRLRLNFVFQIILPCDTKKQIYQNKNSPCILCDRLPVALTHLFAEDNRERSYQEVANALQKCCVQWRCAYASYPLSKTFAQWLIAQQQGFFADDESAYHTTTWTSRKGSRVWQVEEILKTAGHPMHFREIYQALRRQYPSDRMLAPHNVHAALTRENGPFLLWDRGTFVHRQCVTVPAGILPAIENWLVDRLSNIDAPMILIGAAWRAWEEVCLVNGLISEYALYTCLRISGSPELVYPKYPQVYLKKNFETRLPYTWFIEEFIAQNGGVISSEDLRAFAIDGLGLKEYQFQQGLARIDGVFRNAQGEYVSVRHLEIDLKVLDSLNSYIVTLSHSTRYISVEKILEDKRAICQQAGISDSVLLYNALKAAAPEDVSYPGYPSISWLPKEKSRLKGFYHEVWEWLKERNQPCSWDELEDWFVQKKKFKENALRTALRGEEVFQYGQGLFAHRDALGVDSDVLRAVAAAAEYGLKQSRDAEKPFALSSDILDHRCQTLPLLKNEIFWTQTLLVHVIDSLETFKIIGSARNAFIYRTNTDGIETFDDLIYILLKNKYGGSCPLKEFEQYLRAERIIAKSLTPFMLSGQSRLVIQEGVIHLLNFPDQRDCPL